MKRKVPMDNNLEYDKALKKVSLVERNPNPNGTKILSLNAISFHESKDIVELASQIQNANAAIKNNTCGKLGVIYEQIKFLQAQAQKILEETAENNSLHHAACNFQKIPGKIYHLYKRPSGQTYFSMLSPEEWGSAGNHQHLGSYRLEPDQSWTPVEKIEQKNKLQAWSESITGMNSNILAIDQTIEMES